MSWGTLDVKAKWKENITESRWKIFDENKNASQMQSVETFSRAKWFAKVDGEKFSLSAWEEMSMTSKAAKINFIEIFFFGNFQNSSTILSSSTEMCSQVDKNDSANYPLKVFLDATYFQPTNVTD